MSNTQHKDEYIDELQLENGKYTIRKCLDGRADKPFFECLRYGKKWRDLSGDKLMLVLVHRIEELETQLNNSPKVDYLQVELDNRIKMAQSKLVNHKTHISELLNDEKAWEGYLSACKWFKAILDNPHKENKERVP